MTAKERARRKTLKLVEVKLTIYVVVPAGKYDWDAEDEELETEIADILNERFDHEVLVEFESLRKMS